MKIIVVGIGKAGLSLIESLMDEGADVTVIEKSAEIVKKVTDKFNVNGVVGSGASRETLLKAGANTADMLIALTAVDEVNLLSCMQAKNLGTRRTAARLLLTDLTQEREALKQEYSIDYIISPKVDIAHMIYQNVGLPGNVKLEGFFDEKIQMLELNVLKDSVFAGNRLCDVKRKLNAEILIVAVKRKGKLVVPTGDFVCEPSDDIYMVADTEGMKNAFSTMEIVKKPAKHVLIVGGGATTEYVAGMLLKDRREVTILDDDIDRCQHLMATFPKASVAFGNMESVETLEEVDLSKKDVVISVTERDETNLVVSLFSWAKGVHSIITRVDSPEHVKLLHNVNMDITVSPSELATNKLLRFVKNYEVGDGENEILRFYSICDGAAEIMEFKVRGDFKYKNVTLKDPGFCIKKDSLIAAVIRDDEVVIPNGETCLKENDRVVIVSSKKNHIVKLEDLFK